MSVSAPARARPTETILPWALPALLLAGFLVRLLFIGNEGFKTDVETFEAWAMALAQHGFANFYGSLGFADYPPGYLYILGFVGWIWDALFKGFDAGHYVVIKALVKLPAILADLGVGALVYAIVHRFANARLALAAAAFYLLDPAIIYNSAAWGQVDSVAAAFALGAIYCLLRSDDNAPARLNAWIVVAWVLIGYSLLIKPQAAVLLPLMLGFAFVDRERRRVRLISTAVGIVVAVVLAVALVEPFHPSNPVAALSWLIDRYSYGSNVYAYNSVNAFNLWAIRGSMWQPDTAPVNLFGALSLGPQYLWGIVLVVVAVALVLWRYLQERTPRALLEGCAVATIAFFVLATRMHERYLFNGLLFTIVCIPFARRYLWSAVALTAVLFANLEYSLQYLHVVQNNVPGVNAQNLWGPATSVFSLIAVGVFFWLGYQFLGGEPAVSEAPSDAQPVSEAPQSALAAAAGVRRWFDPREGLVAMRAPLDYVLAAVFGVANFVLSFIGYWYPRDKVFDEIYFARAGEEYLQNLRIYENTHPPLTKLLVTLSMMLFGGMPRGHGLGGWTFLNGIIGHLANGDNSYGWRFLDVVFGALAVMLLYVFAKRITGSTFFACVTALLLTADGMHFVQSRIATPEGFVVFFATLATYAFYRFWIGSQTGNRPHVQVPPWGFVAGAALALIAGAILAFAGRGIWKFDVATTITVALYVAAGAYLIVRYALLGRFFGDGARELSFGEGSYALRRGSETTVYAADGGTIDERGKVVRGERSQNRGGKLVYSDDPLTIEYGRDATVAYKTPAGDAVYDGEAVRANDGVADGRSSKLWLIVFTVALGCLVSSKWYGVMGFGVSFIVLIAVFLQRFILNNRPALWGNSRGYRLDGALVTILFVSMTVYALAWAPDLARHSDDPNEIHNLNDVVGRQYSMFEYHDTLKATHPYSSKMWEWPLDIVPVAYYYQDRRADQSNPKGCCIYEITSMPSPAILWFGLLCVPWVAVLAWRERNKGYALIVLTYLLQWLPWAQSPRLTFAYHFYVNIPLICLCNAIVLQRAWEWGKRQLQPRGTWLGGLAVGAYVAVAIGAFVYFYPILAAFPISWDAWHHRMWIDKWVIGPG